MSKLNDLSEILFSNNPSLFFTGIQITIILFAISSVTSNNPVISILYLIACFIASAITFILYSFPFIGYILIMVYVGAIAILFVFIIMLFQTEAENSDKETNYSTYPVLFVISLVPLMLLSYNKINGYQYFLDFNNVYEGLASLSINNFKYEWFNNYSEIAVIGESFFLTNPIYLMFIAILLLVAMVGSIHITVLK